MFKKSADLIHLNERTGSHATKGRGTGLVEIRKLDLSDFHSKESEELRNRAIAAAATDLTVVSDRIAKLTGFLSRTNNQMKKVEIKASLRALQKYSRMKRSELKKLLD